ncbi:hypothetical protein BH10PSE12_BH10PSE12_35530 [soil metagenome]
MSDPFPPVDAAKAARQRHVIIGLFRLSGVFVLMFGFLIMMQRFDWVQGQKAKVMGAIIATAGLIQTIIVPRILLRAWRTPPVP